MSDAVAPLRELRARAAAGHPVTVDPGLPPALRRRLTLVLRLGAPLLPELDRALDDAAADAELAAEVQVASAQARAVARALLVAPLVLVPSLGALLSLDLMGFYGAPPGPAVLAVAAGLHGLGLLWVHLVVRAARSPTRGASAIELVELVAVGVRAGLGVVGALRAAGDVTPDLGEAARRLALALETGTPDDDARLGPLGEVARLAAVLGAPVADDLDRLAADLRRDQRTRARERAARLPALLTPPTALLVLPASLVVVLAPLIAATLTTLAG